MKVDERKKIEETINGNKHLGTTSCVSCKYSKEYIKGYKQSRSCCRFPPVCNPKTLSSFEFPVVDKNDW